MINKLQSQRPRAWKEVSLMFAIGVWLAVGFVMGAISLATLAFDAMSIQVEIAKEQRK